MLKKYKNSNLLLFLSKICFTNITIDFKNRKIKVKIFTATNIKARYPKNVPLVTILKLMIITPTDKTDTKRNLVKKRTDSLLSFINITPSYIYIILNLTINVNRKINLFD